MLFVYAMFWTFFFVYFRLSSKSSIVPKNDDKFDSPKRKRDSDSDSDSESSDSDSDSESDSSDSDSDDSDSDSDDGKKAAGAVKSAPAKVINFFPFFFSYSPLFICVYPRYHLKYLCFS